MIHAFGCKQGSWQLCLGCGAHVPYDAFKARDVAAIEKRNEEYLRSYTKGNETWNSMREDANVIAFLLEV